ncbi:unnamed protein product [Urochloa humidicola]
MPPRRRLPLRVRVAPSSALPVCLLRTAGERLCGVAGARGREDLWSEGTRALSDTTKQAVPWLLEAMNWAYFSLLCNRMLP